MADRADQPARVEPVGDELLRQPLQQFGIARRIARARVIQRLNDARTGQVLENKIRDVAARVEEITGMNFNQFTRAMLLAQGAFAAFLQASADERAPILESITGTEIYSEISRKVHERSREEKNRLEVLQAETTDLKLLTASEEKQLQEE